ncbi:unnamed protein product [Cunninghamella blakesleeana]
MQTVTEEPLYFPTTMTESLNHPPSPITSDNHHHLHPLHINTDNNNNNSNSNNNNTNHNHNNNSNSNNDDNKINHNEPTTILYEKKNETPSTMFMKRSSLTKAERRAEHNAIERARRENLNGKFQQLAESLPNLQSYRRPSKGQIVEKALDWVKQSVAKEDRYQYQIHQLQRENKRLIMQLNMNQQQQPSSSSSFSNNSNNNNIAATIPSPSTSSSTFIHSNQHSPIPPYTDYNTTTTTNNNNNNNNVNDTNIDDSIHPFMIPPPPQLIASPYSIGTNSRRGSAIIDDDDDPEFIMDHSCQVPIMPTSTTPIPADFYFYNDIVTTNNNHPTSNPSPISMNTNWSKMNFTPPYHNNNNSQGLIHPTEMPL